MSDKMQILLNKDAELTRRILSYFIDILICILCPYLFTEVRILLGDINLIAKPFLSEDLFIYLLASFFAVYQIYFIWANNGQTVGGKLLKIKVISSNGQKIPFYKSMIRGISMAIFIPPINGLIGYIIFGITLAIALKKDPATQRHRTAWDLLAGTCVVDAYSYDKCFKKAV